MIRTTLLTSLFVSSFAFAEGPSAEVSSGVSTSEPSPRAYVSVFAGTTLLTRGGAGDLAGPSKDFSPMVGAGYLINDTWAVELDVGPTFVAGTGYTGLALMPGVVITLNSYVYLCARLLATVHPGFALAGIPGIGLTYTFKGGWAPFAELDGVIAQGTGGAAVSAAFSVGLEKFF
jgi:hypothetical protein